MKKCVCEIMDSLEEADRHFFDLKPYMRDGLMRMVLCCKRGSDVPLRYVTGDPLSRSTTLFSTRENKNDDRDARGNCSITQHLNNPFDSVDVEADPLRKESAPVATRKGSTSKCSTKAATATPRVACADRMDGVLPASVVPLLQAAIDSEKSQGCVVGGNYVYEKERFFVYCKNSGTRHCIANSSGHMHENENAYLCFEGGYIV